MRLKLVIGIFDLLACLPLRTLHFFGAVLGWLMFRLSASYAGRLRENLRNAFPDMSEAEFQKLLSANVKEAGKSVTELPWVWRRSISEVLKVVREVHGWDAVEIASAKGKGVVILLPHLGCFEVVGTLLSSRKVTTCLYRVPKLAWLDVVMRAGRDRGLMKSAKADVSGVRILFKGLKKGELNGILPDQVPSNGEGEWATFFDRPAYTMTLAPRLIEASGAAVFMCYAERLPAGAGYNIYFSELEISNYTDLTQKINHALEDTIRRCPSQYLWSYNRYKTPSGATPYQVKKEIA
jgi:KDO2-lipid IV(A) lauroyltransferase